MGFTIVIVCNKCGIVYLNQTKQKMVYYVAKKSFESLVIWYYGSMYVVLLLTRFLASLSSKMIKNRSSRN